MSVRRNTTNRLILYRTCGTCGASFSTTADTPFVRQMPRDGKRQATTYFCSESCKNASYKHLFDGKAHLRRAEREAKRDITAKNRLYYERHAEVERARAKERYWSDPERYRTDNRYQRKKRTLQQIENR